jgi:sporulation protein YlmC with PRC-barrel domain
MMLRRVSVLTGYNIEATDGEIGSVQDFYFDDETWTIRYLVADTGWWLPGRSVLISPEALDRPAWDSRRLPVTLTKAQVEHSPGVETDKPVSRQKERELRTYYRWPLYWTAQGAFMPAAAGTQAEAVAALQAGAQAEKGNPQSIAEAAGDPHLRSVNEVIGYDIQAREGEIGHVEDFIVDDETWIIRYTVVDSGNWLPSKNVLIAPQWIQAVDWAGHQLRVGLTRETIADCPEYTPAVPISPEYELRLLAYYGKAAAGSTRP